MTDTKTLSEASRSPLDGTESVRLATSGANWRTTLSSLWAATPIRGYLSGLNMSTSASSTTLTINAGTATSSDNLTALSLGSNYTKTFSAWAVGSGNGALDTGSIAASTWYHVFLIGRLDTGVTDVLFSTSLTPTMPTNYTASRRIGSIRTDTNPFILVFTQDGDRFNWLTQSGDVAATNPGTSAVLRTLLTPPGVNTVAFGVMGFSTTVLTSNPASILLTDPALTDSAPAVGTSSCLNYSAGGTSSNYFTYFSCRTNTSSQVRSRLQISDGNIVLNINTDGYYDTRGQYS